MAGIRQTLASGAEFARHLHAEPYAAIVVRGAYDEAGDAGRWRARAGDVLMHGAYSIHRNRQGSGSAEILNLPIGMASARWPAHCRVSDPDALLRTACRDPLAAIDMLFEQLRPGGTPARDAVDSLALYLTASPNASVARWSEQAGMRRETAYRQFRTAYGIGPARYRLEARARHAWREIVYGVESLAAIAAETGFTDQAHMNRAVGFLTGYAPGAWRRRAVLLQH